MILKQIRKVLSEDGTKVYFPSQHKGECTEKYIVVKHDGATEEFTVSSERPIYTIMCYVPYENYGQLEQFVLETKQKMKKLYPLVMYVGNDTPSIYENDIKSHMISFQYQGCRKIESF